jgi:predicted nucleic acid-binding protein
MMDLYAVHSFSEIVEDSLNKALELEITVHYAAFLSLAVKLYVPLITLDMRLSEKLESTKYNSLIECPTNKA